MEEMKMIEAEDKENIKSQKTIYDCIMEKLGPLEVAAHLVATYDGLCELCPIYKTETYRCRAYWAKENAKTFMCFAIFEEWITRKNEHSEDIANDLIYGQ